MLDFLLDTNRDLAFEDGDLVTGVADQQHQEDLLIQDKGSSKEFPMVGVGCFKYLESEDAAGLLREINIQFSADGMEVKSVGFDIAGKIIVNAAYK